MHNFHTFLCIIFSFLTGIGVGMVSLLLSTVLHRYIDAYVLISLLVYAAIEEITKSMGLYGLKATSSFWQKPSMMICSGGLIGLGFGIFELILVVFNTAPLTPAILLVIGIHLMTGLIIGLGVLLSQRFPFLFVVALLLAIGLHVWYNHIVTQTQTFVPLT